MFLQKRLSFVVSFGSSGPQEQRLLGGLCLHTTLTLSRAFSPSLLFFSCRPFFLFASLSECCFRVSDPGLVNKLKGESSIIFCLFNNLNEKRRDQHQTFWLWIYIYIFFFSQHKLDLLLPCPSVLWVDLCYFHYHEIKYENRCWRNIFHLVSQSWDTLGNHHYSHVPLYHHHLRELLNLL